MVDPELLGALIAVGAAVIGTVFGILLSEWLVRRREKRDTHLRAARAAALLVPDLGRLIEWAETLPSSQGDVTDPGTQLVPHSGGLNLQQHQLLLDLPRQFMARLMARQLIAVELSDAVSRARIRADEVSSANAAALPARSWATVDSSDSDFYHRYAEVSRLRSKFLEGKPRELEAQLNHLADDAYAST